MAIYKGRSVQIISTIPVDEPSITIAHKDGSTSLVKPSELHFTKVELDRIQKDSTKSIPSYKFIDDKTHQELLDGQDPVKMEAKMKK